MHTYEFMNTMVADRRTELESAARAWRMTKPRSLRSWFRRASKVAETGRREITFLTRTVPATGTAAFDAWLSALGDELARGGVQSVEGHLRALVRRARELDIAALSAGVLADRHAPEVARVRAFGRVVLDFGTTTAAGTIAVDAAA